MSSQKTMSSAQDIDVLVVIDTELAKREHPNPGEDRANPARLGQNSYYIIASNPRSLVFGQGTAELKINALPGDRIKFRGISILQNTDDTLIVYDVKHASGDHIFNQFTPNLVKRNKGVRPDPSSRNGMPPISGELNFISFDSSIKQSGTEHFYLSFALYILHHDEETQFLLGYYCLEINCTVPD